MLINYNIYFIKNQLNKPIFDLFPILYDKIGQIQIHLKLFCQNNLDSDDELRLEIC